jgi:ethanolamine utilization protein EutN
MKMVKVIGSVTSTIKEESLKDFKLLFVQMVDLKLKGKKEYYVVVDTVGLGEGEVGLIVTGSTAKMTDATKDKIVDGTIIARVDRLDMEENVEA